jgi:hypothetical protein
MPNTLYKPAWCLLTEKQSPDSVIVYCGFLNIVTSCTCLFSLRIRVLHSVLTGIGYKMLTPLGAQSSLVHFLSSLSSGRFLWISNTQYMRACLSACTYELMHLSSVHSSTGSFTHLFIYLSIYTCIYPFFPLSSPHYPSINLCIVYPSIYTSIHLSSNKWSNSRIPVCESTLR